MPKRPAGTYTADNSDTAPDFQAEVLAELRGIHSSVTTISIIVVIYFVLSILGALAYFLYAQGVFK